MRYASLERTCVWAGGPRDVTGADGRGASGPSGACVTSVRHANAPTCPGGGVVCAARLANRVAARVRAPLAREPPTAAQIPLAVRRTGARSHAARSHVARARTTRARHGAGIPPRGHTRARAQLRACRAFHASTGRAVRAVRGTSRMACSPARNVTPLGCANR